MLLTFCAAFALLAAHVSATAWPVFGLNAQHTTLWSEAGVCLSNVAYSFDVDLTTDTVRRGSPSRMMIVELTYF
jgi:hypothetical protein